MASSSVYSHCFGQWSGLSGSETLTVPTGTVWIVRDIDAIALLGSAGSVEASRNDATLFWQVGYDGALQADSYQFRGRQVFAAGETIVLTASPGPWDVSVCGYSLLAA